MTLVAGVAQLGEQQTEAPATGFVFWRSRVQSMVLAFLLLKCHQINPRRSRSTEDIFVVQLREMVFLLVGSQSAIPFFFFRFGCVPQGPNGRHSVSKNLPHRSTVPVCESKDSSVQAKGSVDYVKLFLHECFFI